MEWFDIIKYGVALLAAVLAAFFPTFFSKLKAVRRAAEEAAAAVAERDTAVAAAEEATVKAQAAQAELDLTEKMHAEVQAAETALQVFDAFAKQNGTSLGAMKRDNVLNKLQAYALSKGYTFDAEKWGAAIDAFVAVTKVVNAIKR
jgi:hypothetical protein